MTIRKKQNKLDQRTKIIMIIVLIFVVILAFSYINLRQKSKKIAKALQQVESQIKKQEEKKKELKKKKGRISQVNTPNNINEADTDVLEAGYESKEILGTVGKDVPMSRVLIEALVTEAEPHMFDQMLGTAEADFYGHQTKHGSFVFGGSSGYEAVNKDNGTPICSSITAPCIC